MVMLKPVNESEAPRRREGVADDVAEVVEDEEEVEEEGRAFCGYC